MLCACQEVQIDGSSGSTAPASSTTPSGSSIPSCSSTVADCTKGHLFPDNAEICQRCGANYFSATLEFTLNDSRDSYIVSGLGTCERAVIKVPADYKGLPVTGIGDGAFSFCENLIRLELHDGISWLGERMVEYCTSLESLYIPAAITEIPALLAENCTALKTVAIGGQIKSIGLNAFANCTSMEAFDFGDSLETIADCAFYNCSSLQLAALPETVRYIGGGAFSMCTALRSINIPQALQEIGGNPFNGCDALQFNVYKGTTYLGNDTNPYLVFVGRENASIKNIVIHEDTVFVPINDLSESDIESLYIGRSVSEFMVGAFRRNNTLSRIEVSSENKTYHASGNCLIDTAKKLMILGCKNSVIPNDGSVIKIASQVFKDMQGVTSVVIPDAVKELGFNLFWDCLDLETLVIGSGVQKIEENIFSRREKLSKIFYHGTKEQWETIDIFGRATTGGIQMGGNSVLFSKTIYFYSEEKPTEEGNYWHYVDGKPTPWKTEE